tara:strand:+ start:315 stop:689 length:375 start_codon:yes stop_codon:yes gene_type:complete
MTNTFPIWLLGIDYLLAFLMFILLMKFILNLFLSENNNFIFFRFINRIVQPIINITIRITPGFIVQPIIPLYLAWLIFMIRLYILPLSIGYLYIGKFAFTFEKELFTEIKSMFLNIAINLNYGI